jgi:hypothetical protein
MPTTREIDHSLYSRQALADARAAYKEYCRIVVEPLTGTKVRLLIEVLPAYADKDRDVVLSFMNFLLDKALEQQLSSI